MIQRARNDPPGKRRRPSKKAREAEERAIAHGIKPVKSIKDLAFGTPEDGDELLEAIREMRREAGEA